MRKWQREPILTIPPNDYFLQHLLTEFKSCKHDRHLLLQWVDYLADRYPPLATLLNLWLTTRTIKADVLLETTYMYEFDHQLSPVLRVLPALQVKLFAVGCAARCLRWLTASDIPVAMRCLLSVLVSDRKYALNLPSDRAELKLSSALLWIQRMDSNQRRTTTCALSAAQAARESRYYSRHSQLEQIDKRHYKECCWQLAWLQAIKATL